MFGETMLKNLLEMTLKLLLLVSLNASAVCLLPEDAEFEGCMPIESSKADKWCEKKYGKEYNAYYTTDTCSKEVAFSYRNQTYVPTKRDQTKVVEASCMYYEDGIKNSCTVYEYEAAARYCMNEFGGKFIAFVPSETCSLKKAARLRGEVSSKELIKGLESSLEEAQALMTMLDKEGVNSSLGGGFMHKELEINYEFYTNSVLTLLAKMKGIKNTFIDNGKKNIRLSGKYVPHYLKFAFAYLGIHARLHKLYAHVAHKNQNVLKTYSFDNLKEINLKLKKMYGLEILAKVNYKVLTRDGGEYLEFEAGEQDKQTYEYMAMEKPKTTTEYGKLVQYMGVRESLTNHWAVQRLTNQTIPNPAVRECGKGFLSFRPGSNGSMSTSSAMKDLWEYDVFYNDYQRHWGALVDVSREVSLLDTAAAAEMNYYVMTKVSALKKYMSTEMWSTISTDSEFRERAKDDADLRKFAEDFAWDSHSNDHFASTVMPSDGILNKSNIANRIITDAYLIRKRGIIDNIQGTFPYISKNGLKAIDTYVESYLSKVHKKKFESKLKSKILSVLSDYNNESLRSKNRKEKVDNTLAVVKKAVQAARVQNEFSKEVRKTGSIRLLDPENVEELMMFFESKLKKNYDIQFALENNAEWAQELSSYFEAVSKEFNGKFLKQENGKYTYTGSPYERSRSLRKIARRYAQLLHARYPFDVKGYKRQQYNNRISTINANSNSNYNVQPIFKDGLVMPMYANEMRKELSDTEIKNVMDYVQNLSGEEKKKEVKISPLFTGVPSVENRNSVTPGWNRDRVTTGEIAIPTYISPKGAIVSPNGVVGTVNNELLRVVKRANLINKESMAKLEKKPELMNYKRSKSINDAQKIKSMSKFIYRVFSILNLQDVAYSNGLNEDLFAHMSDDQMALAVNKTSQAYQVAPLLRNDYSWSESRTIRRGGRRHSISETKTMPLLEKISLSAYDAKSARLDESKARQMIEKVIDDGIKNVGSKLHKFCVANFLNYKNDQPFKDIFNASAFLRTAIKSPVGSSEKEAKRLEKLDEQIRKDVRSSSEAWNEDYFEPTLKYMGYAALAALAIVLIVGSGGAAAPGVLGGLYTAASTFLAIEFYISFVFVAGSLYSRVNTHFIEMPAQLKFQRSIAQSQVDMSQIVDWDMLRTEESKLKSKQAWTIGLMPLDFLYAGALVRQTGRITGITGRTAYRRLTGTKLKGWGAPPPGTYNIERFKDLRSRLGVPKAIIGKVQQTRNRLRAFQPRYQALPKEMLHGAALRTGLAKAAKEIGIDSKPWIVIEELKAYEATLRSRLKTYEHFVTTEAGVLGKIRLKDKLSLKEVMEHGIQFSKFTFLPKSYWKAVKQGKLGEYLSKHDQLWTELKHMQGEMVKGRADKIAKTIDKMADFKAGIQSGAIAREGDNLMGQMMTRFSDEEILVLKEIARRSDDKMGAFKSVFKNHKKVVESLRPMSYLYGQNQKFFKRALYPMNTFMGDAVDANYSFKSDAEDLINYYESMMQSNGYRSAEFDKSRQMIEEKISQSMTIGDDGARTYHD
jgi:hypothetical protein